MRPFARWGPARRSLNGDQAMEVRLVQLLGSFITTTSAYTLARLEFAMGHPESPAPPVIDRLSDASESSLRGECFGYCLLGRVIERVSGASYKNFIQTEILDVVGIQDMRIATLNPEPLEVIYYPQGGEQPYDISVTRMDSNGGWIATPEDMERFVAALFASKDGSGLLEPSSLSVMTKGTAANPGYGCGLGIDKHGNCMHVGELPGLMSFMFHTPTDYSWFAVINTRRSNSSQAHDLQDMLERVVRSVPSWKAFSYPPEDLSGTC